MGYNGNLSIYWLSEKRMSEQKIPISYLSNWNACAWRIDEGKVEEKKESAKVRALFLLFIV